MAIITLTTDLGINDHYVAALKGKLLSNLPECTIVDITHQVPSFDFIQAARVLKNSFIHFPIGSVHIVSVTTDSDNIRYVAVEYKGHYFLGPDNGFYTVLVDEAPSKIVILPPSSENLSFAVFEILAKAAIKLLQSSINEIGTIAERLNEGQTQQPYLNGTTLMGQIAYIDKFENVITNISETLFEKNRAGRKFSISIRGYEINKIHSNYDKVVQGELVALFNSNKMLEIALNKGKAKGLLFIKFGDNIAIEFYDN